MPGLRHRSLRSLLALAGAALSATLSAEPIATPRVDPLLGPLARFHVRNAAARLAKPACAEVLDDFTDAEGQPLSRRLAVFQLSPSEYLARLAYVPAPPRGPCESSGILAFTSPGSFVIRVCAAQLLSPHRRDDSLAATILIHEMLHSLGLGEDPPTSAEITARVKARCGG